LSSNTKRHGRTVTPASLVLPTRIIPGSRWPRQTANDVRLGLPTPAHA
jgi:hypothetical protein